MQDRPTAAEIAEAVWEFLEEELLPNLEDQQIESRVQAAIIALSILERELAQEEKLLEEEHERLARLLDEYGTMPGSLEKLKDQVGKLNRELSGRIRSGGAPEGTFEHLMRTVTGKLEVARPRYLERDV